MDSDLICINYSIIFAKSIICLFIIAYITFAVIGVINTSINEQYELCNKSHIWIYNIASLASLLMSFVLAIILKMTNIDFKCIFITLIYESIILSGMCIWGIYEFFGVSCFDKLSKTILYKLTFVHWMFNIFILAELLLCIIYILYEQLQ